MQIACACASASIAASTLMSHSWSSIFLVIACAKFGPAASEAASARASSPSASGSTSRLKKPQRSPSSALIERPVNSSSAVRPWPMIRGSIAQTPMSEPASPTRVNRNATLARGRAEPQVAGGRDRRPGAGADPVDGGDDRLRAVPDRLHEVAGHAREASRPPMSIGSAAR